MLAPATRVERQPLITADLTHVVNAKSSLHYGRLVWSLSSELDVVSIRYECERDACTVAVAKDVTVFAFLHTRKRESRVVTQRVGIRSLFSSIKVNFHFPLRSLTLSIMLSFHTSLLAATAGFFAAVSAQTFQRLGGCPTLGCVFPPDQQDFLAGQYFDIRLEIHAPVNGSETTNGKPDTNFTFTIGKVGQAPQPAAAFFGLPEPVLETWYVTIEIQKDMWRSLGVDEVQMNM